VAKTKPEFREVGSRMLIKHVRRRLIVNPKKMGHLPNINEAVDIVLNQHGKRQIVPMLFTLGSANLGLFIRTPATMMV
jgi:hypothetical protein